MLALGHAARVRGLDLGRRVAALEEAVRPVVAVQIVFQQRIGHLLDPPVEVRAEVLHSPNGVGHAEHRQPVVADELAGLLQRPGAAVFLGDDVP